MLYDIVINALLPPMVFLWLLLFGLAFRSQSRFPRLRGRLSWTARLVGIVGLLLSGMPVVATTAMALLERGMTLRPALNDTANRPGCIIILAGDLANGETQGALLPGPQIGGLTLSRVRAGAVLARATGLPILVTGGVDSKDGPAIARRMAAMLRDEFNVPVRWVEPAATDSWENAVYSAAMLRPEGINSAYVVTNSWHLPRALLAFRRIGFTAYPAPDSLDMIRPPDLSSFLPHPKAWLNSYYAAHEVVGYVYYALRH